MEKEMQDLLNNISEMVSIIDKNFVYQYVNRPYSRFFDLEPEEMIGKDSSGYFREDTFREKIKPLFEKCLTGTDSTVKIAVPRVKPSGDRILEMRIQPHTNGDDTENRILLTARDVSREEQTKTSLSESEELFRSTFENINVGIATVQPDGTLKRINKVFCEITGYTQDELEGMNFADITHPDDLETDNGYIAEVLEGKRDSYTLEKRYIRKNGDHVWIKMHSNVVRDDNGNPLYAIAAIHDISDWKRLQEETEVSRESAEKNEAMFRAAMENSQAGIAIAEVPSGQLLFVNKAGLLVRDKEYKDIVANVDLNKYVSSWQILDFDGTPLKIEEVPLARAVMYGETNSRDFIVRRDNLEDRYVWANAGPILDNNGKQIAAIVVFLDITEYKQIQFDLEAKNRELEEARGLADINREKHRFLFENTIQGVVYHDKTGAIIGANKAACRILGITMDQLKGKTAMDPRWRSIHEDGSPFPGTDHPVQQTLKTSKPVINQKMGVFNPQDDSYHWININSFPRFRDGESAPHEVIVTFEDITAVHRAAEELERSRAIIAESEEQFRRLFENMEQGFALHRMIYNDDGKPVDYEFMMMNKAFENLTGMKSSDYVGKRVREVLPMLEQSWIDNYGQVAQTGEPLHFDSYSQDLDRHYDVIAYSPKQDYFAVVFTDVTQNKLYEQQLLESKERAEMSDRLKTEFLNNMSHEIRTPMNGIIGFSELLDERDITSEIRQYYSRIIQNSAQQLLKIIDDILEISTLETKQVKLNNQPVNINELLMEQFSIFSLQAKERNIPLYIKKSLSDSAATITTDRTKLTKVLNNLIENAFKYTYKGTIEIGYDLAGGMICIYVKDTGIGIAEKNMEMIFQRFSREKNENSEDFGGLGIGLSIAKENTELLGGEIKLQSEKGKGSTFTIMIPYQPVDTEDRAASPENPPKDQPDRCHILIAEDDEVNYLYLEAIIAKEPELDCRISHAINGRNAVEFCKKHSDIDLILMDIKMPDGDGYKTTDEIRKFRPDVPIIAQTAYSTPEDRTKALESGCNEFISKPIDRQQFIKILIKYLPGKRKAD